ncbi:hypothetical protein CR513_13522, partial [Mucuna pruriens]
MLEEFKDIFLKEMPHGLPSIREIKLYIDFVPGASLPNRPTYRENPEESKEIQKQVTQLLDKGLVRKRLSLYKRRMAHGGCLRTVDLLMLSRLDIDTLIPCLDDLLDVLHGACVFSKIDLRNGYPQICMKEGNERKTSFKTKLGLYK